MWIFQNIDSDRAPINLPDCDVVKLRSMQIKDSDTWMACMTLAQHTPAHAYLGLLTRGQAMLGEPWSLSVCFSPSPPRKNGQVGGKPGSGGRGFHIAGEILLSHLLLSWSWQGEWSAIENLNGVSLTDPTDLVVKQNLFHLVANKARRLIAQSISLHKHIVQSHPRIH